ncbi:MAG: sugar ABC transporter permease [Spirochaetia bacterium]
MKRGIGSIRRAPYLFVLPFIVSFLMFYLYPLVSTVIMSFQEIVPGQTRFIGLLNYERLMNPFMYTAVWNSFRYTVFTILILIPVPILLAVMLNNPRNPANAIFRAALFIPTLVSVVVAGTIIRLLFAASPSAVVNTVLGLFKVKPSDWVMGGSTSAMVLLVGMATWRWTGVNIIYYLSGLQNIPQELYEAANIDGASASYRFFHITIPLLKPTIIFLTTISIFGGFAMFEESYILWVGLLGGGSPNNVGLTMVGYLYLKGFQGGAMGLGSAIGLILFLIVLIVSILQLNVFGFFKREAT